MEYGAILIVFLVQMIVGILSYKYWLRNYGAFARVKAEFVRSLEERRNNGSLDQYIEDFTSGKISISSNRKRLATLGWMFVAMVAGVAVCIVIMKFIPVGLFLRSIIAIIAVSPFLYLVSVAVAEEADENKISGFEKAAREQLPARKESGTIDSWIAEL